MGNCDNSIQNRVPFQKAAKAPAHHSDTSEHFQENFPLFINRWEEGFELREHDHAYLEIVYVLSGDGYHYVGDRIQRAAKGCLYILPVGTSHVLRPSGASSGLIVYNLCIRPAFIEELRNWLSLYEADNSEIWNLFGGAPDTSITLVDQGMKMGPWLDRMHREYEDKPLGYEASMFAGLMQVIVLIARMLQGQKAEADSRSLAKTRRTGMTEVMEYIDAHATERLTAEELAAQAGMSRRHFIRLFTQAAGMGFSDYLQMRRVEYASRMLHDTDDKIAYIARSAGYRDPAHFREVFRKIMGVSPKAYRAGCRKSFSVVNHKSKSVH